MDSARALLDELMGADRNVVKGADYVPRTTFESEHMCRHYLVDFCPHELFINTKSDLGVCKKTHDERMRDEYRNSEKCGRLGFEQEFFDYLKKLIHDLERRIKRGKERLNYKEGEEGHPVADEYTERSIFIEEQMKDLIEKMERYGEEGKVTEASDIMKQVDDLKREQERILRQKETNPILKQEKRMEVCEVCGALLIAGDPQHRLESHFEGRQHLGYMKIRETFEKIRGDFERPRGNGYRESDRSRRSDHRHRYDRRDRSGRTDDREDFDRHRKYTRERERYHSHHRDRSLDRSKERSPVRSKRDRSTSRDRNLHR